MAIGKFRGFIPEDDLEKTVEESLDGSRMEDFVSEVLEAMETDSPFGGGSEEGDSGEETPPEETVPEKDPSGKTSSGEEIHYISLDDMMDQTGTEIVIRKDKTEPSPIFGPGDTKPHDKYVVTLRNKNGSASFSFWSSLADTESGNQPDKAEMLASIAQDCAEYGDSMSLEEFRTRFGYDDVDVEVAQKSYEGFRKLVDDVRTMFGGAGFATSQSALACTAFAPLLLLCAYISFAPRLPKVREWRFAAPVLIILCLAALVSQGYAPFVYFQF